MANRLITPVIRPYQSLRRKLRQPFEKFLASRSGPYPDGVTLDSSRVYIIPTRVGMIFALLLLVLLLGSINYTKSLGFVLTFLLASLGNIGMLMTWKNLAGLRLKGIDAAPVFAGQNAVFNIQIENTGQNTRYAICAPFGDNDSSITDVEAGGLAVLSFPLQTEKRGLINPGRVRIETEYPLGLFVAWTWIDLDMHGMVYPAPSERAPLTPSVDTQSGEEQAEGEGLEDFAGLRKYHPGDSLRRVSWKVMARTDELFSKEFTGGQPELQWVDWFEIDARNLEERLSIMTRLVLDAEQSGRFYGLRIPGQELTPSNGKSHLHECLKTMALYGQQKND